MARLKWNAATGRFVAAQMPSKDSGYENTPVGATYIDTVTGEAKIRNAGTQPDTVVRQAPSTTLVPSKNTTKSTTVAPKGKTTSTAPAGVAPAGGKGKINTSGRGMGGPTAAQVASGQFVGGPKQVADESSTLKKAIEEAFASDDYAGAMALLTLMNGGSSGSGSGAPSKESLAAGYNAAITAANMTEKAGTDAQSAYNLQGQNLYDTQVAAINKYYGEQSDAANAAIDKAGADFTASMPEATAYANAQVANLPQAQQGLTGALEAYGATNNQAQGQSEQDRAYLDALAKMQTSSNTQLSEADKTYMASLRRAAEGNRTQAKQTLAGNIGTLKAQDTSAANATRQGLIGKGLESMLAGKTDAASQRAKAVVDFGKPKKAKAKPKPKPKSPKK
ncbi:hypothetical protein UFOVP587_2 [uncultured Caudovirales phage]|uniref:Uncharacterized protein n=1 Tax=uncultured Caudovirales phage TaxID=2100421 RepID=A0A6J5MW27_9CAUD|nr:hypothetical protein UFOVP587_2 [uncultured Caudovirales phage]